MSNQESDKADTPLRTSSSVANNATQPKAAPTPGPWHVHDRSGREIWATLGPVAMTTVRADDDGTEQEANARLIAAAPETLHQRDRLLEVCQHWFEWHANHFGDFCDEANQELLCLANETEPAIADVTGE